MEKDKEKEIEKEKSVVTTSSTTKSGKKGNSTVWFWSAECKYEVILDRVKEIGWKPVEDEKKESKCNVFWIDVASINERFRTIQPWQVINHFPGMPNIARKNRMGQNLNRMARVFPKEYNYIPKTWVLPGELADFRAQFDSQGNSLGNKIFIIKPDTGCQGRGIFLTRNFEEVPQTDNVVAQSYLMKPLLIDGYKFDLRLYILVTGVKPFRIYLFHDGLVRMCTEKFVKPSKQNMNVLFMHLTNYAVNKKNTSFQQASGSEDDSGSKRTLKWFMSWIAEEYGEEKAKSLWKRFGSLAARTIMSIAPTLSREYDAHFRQFANVPKSFDNDSDLNSEASTTTDENGAVREKSDEEKERDRKEAEKKRLKRGSRCVEVLGIDVIVDANLRPILLEFNHLPSFGTDSPLDQDVKGRLMEEVFKVIYAEPDDEAAFDMYQKIESDRRLKEDRTAASQAKMREKLERERARERENERRARLKISRMRAEMQKERGGAGEVVIERPEDIKVIESPEELATKAAKRLQEIVELLVKIYEKHCPSKVSKIEKLLDRYRGREEEFLSFVTEKYHVDMNEINPPPANLVKEEATFDIDQTIPKDHDSNDIPLDPLMEVAQEMEAVTTCETESADDGGGKGQAEEEQTQANEVSGEDIVSELRSRDKKKPPLHDRRHSRSLSPHTIKRNDGNFVKDLDDEEAYKKEVLAIHVPAEDDHYLLYEEEVLVSFTRLFPPPKRVKDEATGEEKADVEGEVDEEDEEEESNLSKATKSADNNKPKRKVASLQDILLETFIQDRKQTLRLRAPIASRSKSQEPSSRSSLPALHNEPFKASANGKANQNGRALPGWKPPPQRQDSVPKNPAPDQIEAAERLSKGFSASKDYTSEPRINRNVPRTKNMIISAKHRIYTNTHTSSGSAGGYVYANAATGANQFTLDQLLHQQQQMQYQHQQSQQYINQQQVQQQQFMQYQTQLMQQQSIYSTNSQASLQPNNASTADNQFADFRYYLKIHDDNNSRRPMPLSNPATLRQQLFSFDNDDIFNQQQQPSQQQQQQQPHSSHSSKQDAAKGKGGGGGRVKTQYSM